MRTISIVSLVSVLVILAVVGVALVRVRRSRRIAVPERGPAKRVDALLDALPDRSSGLAHLDAGHDARVALVALGLDAVPQLLTRLHAARTGSATSFWCEQVIEILGEIGDPRSFEPLERLFGSVHGSAAARALASFPPDPHLTDHALAVLSNEPGPGEESRQFDLADSTDVRNLLLAWRVPISEILESLNSSPTERSRALLLTLLVSRQQAEGAVDPHPFLCWGAETEEAIVLSPVIEGLDAFLDRAPMSDPARGTVRDFLAPLATGTRRAVSGHRFDDPGDNGTDKEPPHFGIEQAATEVLARTDRAGQEIAARCARSRLMGFIRYRTIDEVFRIARSCDDDLYRSVQRALQHVALQKPDAQRDQTSVVRHFHQTIDARFVGAERDRARAFIEPVVQELTERGCLR